MKTLPLFPLLACSVVFSLGSLAPAQSVDFQSYNAIIFNDLSTTSDIEGRTFVGNDLTSTNSANFGIHLPNTTASDDRVLVVGGDIVNGNPLNLQYGSLYVGGDTNGRIINYNGGGTTVADNGIASDLAEIRDYSISQSLFMQDLTPNSTVDLPSGQPGPTRFLASSGVDGLAVFNVNAADIFSNPNGQQIELIPDVAVSSVIINVSGSSVNWTSANMVSLFTDDYWQGHVLWNFHEATSIDFDGRNFHGAVLAPYATVTTSANIDGLVVANNLITTGEVHLPADGGDPYYPPDIPPIPEPGTALFIAAAAGYLLIIRNRRLAV